MAGKKKSVMLWFVVAGFWFLTAAGYALMMVTHPGPKTMKVTMCVVCALAGCVQTLRGFQEWKKQRS